MKKNLGFILCFWFLFYGSCLARFVVEKNSLKVTSPASLRNVYECAIGNFGVPKYGGTMSGIVVYPKTNQVACKDFDSSFKSRPGGMPTFLLVDRGGKYIFFLDDFMISFFFFSLSVSDY